MLFVEGDQKYVWVFFRNLKLGILVTLIDVFGVS